MRWGHFTDFYPIDCDFVFGDGGDGTLNWLYRMVERTRLR